MRTKSCKNRNYTSKGKTTKSNGQKDGKITDNENVTTHVTKRGI